MLVIETSVALVNQAQSMKQSIEENTDGQIIIELVMKVISAIWLIPEYGFAGTCITEPVTWVLMTAFLLAVYWIKTRILLAEDEPGQLTGAAYS